MTDIYLTRHGETVWNTKIMMQGRCNSPLTENGIAGAVRLGGELKDIPFTGCLVSPLPRAMHTAHLITSQNSSRIPIDIDPLLLEMDLGSWEGMCMKDAKEKYPEAFDAFRFHPDQFRPVESGETFFDVRERALRFLDNISKRYDGGNGNPVLVVSHMILVQAMINIAKGETIETMRDIYPIEQTKIYRIRLSGGPGRSYESLDI